MLTFLIRCVKIYLILLRMDSGKYCERIILLRDIIHNFNIIPTSIKHIKMMIMYYILTHHLYMRIFLKELQ
nr:MAG TPA: hypothetical protein [Caudoviricetes sp.]